MTNKMTEPTTKADFLRASGRVNELRFLADELLHEGESQADYRERMQAKYDLSAEDLYDAGKEHEE